MYLHVYTKKKYHLIFTSVDQIEELIRGSSNEKCLILFQTNFIYILDTFFCKLETCVTPEFVFTHLLIHGIYWVQASLWSTLYVVIWIPDAHKKWTLSKEPSIVYSCIHVVWVQSRWRPSFSICTMNRHFQSIMQRTYQSSLLSNGLEVWVLVPFDPYYLSQICLKITDRKFHKESKEKKL